MVFMDSAWSTKLRPHGDGITWGNRRWVWRRVTYVSRFML